MPTFQEVFDFAEEICNYTGQEIINESEISRVILLK
jgi:wyosine [tRNA(Phe)-imidazoG37] synthetase (radical SAM superfamily)